MTTLPGLDLVDIGANLTDNAFRNDRQEIIKRAHGMGVSQILVTGTSMKASSAAVDLAMQHPDRLFATAGLHPHNASDWNSHCNGQLIVLARNAQVVAIGETGLDFNRDFSPRPDQEHAFEAQLELAAALRLPVFIHERDSRGRVAAILRNHRDDLCGAVIHCFTGTTDDLTAYLGMDLHVGITGWICDERRGKRLRELAPRIPLHRLVVETDAPYLLPRDLIPKPKHRRNEPACLPHIVNSLAKCMGLDAQVVAQHTTRNARALFDLPKSPAE